MPRKPVPCCQCGKPCRLGGNGSLPEPTCLECRRKNPGRLPSWAEDQGGHYFETRECADCTADLARTERTVCGPCAISRRRERQREKARRSTSGRVVAARRRRLRRGESYDGVSDREIFDRDRWRCWLCRKVIGRKIRYPHPRSASIDHIVPLSLGGDDTALNKRAAHLTCNMTRSNRIDQMPLFGYAADLAPKPKRTLHPRRNCMDCGIEIPGGNRRRRCRKCSEGHAREREWKGDRARAMRADGMKWQDISDALGLSGPGTAYGLVNYRGRAA